jgi:hypothetical protein
MLGPRRNRVREILSDHALEARNLARLVEPTEQVVKRSVLEQDEDDVIKGAGAINRHGFALSGLFERARDLPNPMRSDRMAATCRANASSLSTRFSIARASVTEHGANLPVTRASSTAGRARSKIPAPDVAFRYCAEGPSHRQRLSIVQQGMVLLQQGPPREMEQSWTKTEATDDRA